MAVEHTRLFLEGRNDELVAELRERMTEAAAAERFEQAAQLRDAIRTIETLRDAAAEDGRRRARRSRRLRPEARAGRRRRAGLPGARRPGGRADRARVGAGRDARRGAGRGAEGVTTGSATSCRRRCSSSTPIAPAPPEIHLPVALQRLGHRDARRLAVRAGRTPRPARRAASAARSAACSNSRRATPQVAYQARFNENVAAHYDALETLRAVLALPAMPRRIECFDISTIQGSETVASMVVCEDGRMKRAEYRKFRITGSALGARRSALAGSRCAPTRPRRRKRSDHGSERRAPSADSARFFDDFASMHEVVLRRYRKLLETGGPFPDLILIDGGKGQLSAAYEALEELGLGTWSRSASPRRRSCSSRAIARIRSRWQPRARRCC